MKVSVTLRGSSLEQYPALCELSEFSNKQQVMTRKCELPVGNLGANQISFQLEGEHNLIEFID